MRRPLASVEIAGVFAAGLIGFVIAAMLCSRGTIEVDRKIALSTLLQIAATAGVAWLVTASLQRHSANERKEKDLLLSHLAKADDYVEAIEASVRAGEYGRIVSTLKSLSENSNMFDRLVAKLTFPDAVCKEAEYGVRVIEIRRLLTDQSTTDEQSGQENVRIENDRVAYSDSRRALIEVKLRQLRERLLWGQIQVNAA